MPLPHIDQIRLISARRVLLAIKGRIVTFLTLLVGEVALRLMGRKASDVWIIGENRGECLKENGYWFYQHCRKQHPERKTYFVIKETSPFFQSTLHKDPYVIRYGTIKHSIIFLKSTICFYTHTYRDLTYRRNFELFGRKKRVIFLHHGVLGFKKFNAFYRSKRNLMDIFTVGSLVEKQILTAKEGVDEHRIKCTGYARYDHFFDRSKHSKMQLLYMPTHRNYLKSSAQKSAFLKMAQHFMHNPCLIKALENHDATLKVYLHKELQPFSSFIEPISSRVKVVRLGEETPLELLCDSHLLITDYSSVSWDFFYLGKPVLFYRFDIEKYLNDRDSYMDLREETMGEVLYTEDELVSSILEAIQYNFFLKEKYARYRSNIIPHLDKSNCERIYNEALLLGHQTHDAPK